MHHLLRQFTNCKCLNCVGYKMYYDDICEQFLCVNCGNKCDFNKTKKEPTSEVKINPTLFCKFLEKSNNKTKKRYIQLYLRENGYPDEIIYDMYRATKECFALLKKEIYDMHYIYGVYVGMLSTLKNTLDWLWY